MPVLPETSAEYFWDACRQEWGPAPLLLGNASPGPQWLDPQPGHHWAGPSAGSWVPTAGAPGEAATGDAAGKQKDVSEAPETVVKRKLRLLCSCEEA